MRIRLLHAWQTATTGYWFVPAVMLAGATALALSLVALDEAVTRDRWPSGWLYAGGPEGAKTLLSTVAGSIVTVAGVVFSITIAALTQASAQFGPRLLRNFMRDTGNQVVLGTFVATFLYCLLVLRTVHGETDLGDAFVPHLSVTVAVLLAAASIGVLIYFIHHVSVSLQAPTVIATVLAELNGILDRLPEGQGGAAVPAGGGGEVDPALPADFEAASRPILSTRQGHVQAVDFDALVAIAEERDLVLRLVHRPGDYLIRGNALAHACPGDRCDDDVDERVNATVICGRHPTSEQDVEHAVRQIVEIAVRALSAGINDPFTATNCIDALGAGICRAARRGLPGPLRFDETGRLRLIVPVTTFEGLVDTAFNQIRQHGRRDVAVTIRLLETLAACLEQVVPDEHRRHLYRHAEMVMRQAEQHVAEPADLEAVRDRCRRIERAACGITAAGVGRAPSPPPKAMQPAGRAPRAAPAGR